jgi:hypothetical protein
MKKALAMAAIMSWFLGLIGCGKAQKAESSPADIYHDLRQQVLNLDPAKIGLKASGPNGVWAVLMETRYPEAVVTLVTIGDGTVSLYFSNGGGIIGAGQHDAPRKACIDLLSAAPPFLKHAKPTKEFPLPDVGHTRFYFLTFDGALTADANEEDLGENRLPLSPLFHKAHEVITAALATEKEARANPSALPRSPRNP